jgi:hypothetical protein
MPTRRASRKRQLESMTREAIIKAWLAATKKTELSGAKTVRALIDEVLDAEYPANPPASLPKPPAGGRRQT